MYSLKALVLDGCPYCEKLKELLTKYNIPTEYIETTFENKEKFKIKYNIETFPQVYLIKNKDDKGIALGGYTDVQDIVDQIKTNNYDKIKEYIENKYYFISNKKMLRIIETFSQVNLSS